MPLRHKLDALLSHPEHGTADQLTPLRGMFDEVPNPDSVTVWLALRRTGARLHHHLAMRAHEKPLTHDALDDYPQDYALQRIRRLLIHAGVLPDRTDLLDRIEPWLDQALERSPEHHETRDLLVHRAGAPLTSRMKSVNHPSRMKSTSVGE